MDVMYLIAVLCLVLLGFVFGICYAVHTDRKRNVVLPMLEDGLHRVYMKDGRWFRVDRDDNTCSSCFKRKRAETHVHYCTCCGRLKDKEVE